MTGIRNVKNHHAKNAVFCLKKGFMDLKRRISWKMYVKSLMYKK